jgi:hypothetical protein
MNGRIWLIPKPTSGSAMLAFEARRVSMRLTSNRSLDGEPTGSIFRRYPMSSDPASC